MKVDIWMPLYVADYLAATSRLTTEQHGAYLLILMDYWRNGPPPDDDLVLAQITRMTPDAWSIARASIKHYFEIENGLWKHARVERELDAAKDKKERQTARAKVAAQKRWDKTDATSNAISSASSNARGMLEQCPSPSPSPSKESKPKAIAVSKPDCPHADIILAYHEILPSCPSVRDWTTARRSALKARWDEDVERQNLDYWKNLFKYIAGIPFLVGQSSSAGRRPFFATLPWIVKAENFAKIREGNYE